ncbi:hypothetical protein KEF29_39415 [Streptomyces tuirus]|uniref:Uncharacterized protein n=1 Tax=Streptomyces tuirus TaxID=68278 RepID=A0A941FHJ3_9ACTN|nr:hypothetical protein [Streptomyces tuirus]
MAIERTCRSESASAHSSFSSWTAVGGSASEMSALTDTGSVISRDWK